MRISIRKIIGLYDCCTRVKQSFGWLLFGIIERQFLAGAEALPAGSADRNLLHCRR